MTLKTCVANISTILSGGLSYTVKNAESWGASTPNSVLYSAIFLLRIIWIFLAVSIFSACLCCDRLRWKYSNFTVAMKYMIILSCLFLDFMELTNAHLPLLFYGCCLPFCKTKCSFLKCLWPCVKIISTYWTISSKNMLNWDLIRSAHKGPGHSFPH